MSRRKPSTGNAAKAMMASMAIGAAGCNEEEPPDFWGIDQHASNCVVDPGDISNELYGDELKALTARVDGDDLVVEAQIFTKDPDAVKKVLNSGKYLASLVVEPDGNKNSNKDVFGEIMIDRENNDRGALGIELVVPLAEAPFSIEDDIASVRMWIALGEHGMGGVGGDCTSYIPTVTGDQRIRVSGPADGLNDDDGSVWTVN